MAETNVTLRRRQLAGKLRELRKNTGLTVEQVAQELLCSPPKISRIETAQRPASQRDVRDLCRIYGITDQKLIDHLMTLAREIRQPGLKQEYGDLGDDALYTYMELEEVSQSITEFQTAYIPGLLQTEDYARALIRGLLPLIPEDVLNRRVTARMGRKHILTKENPPRYWTFIDEAALFRAVGGPKIMRAQLQTVLETANLPHVTVQVIPFNVGPYMGAGNPFVLLEVDDQQVSTIVHLELLTVAEYLEKERDLKQYREAIDHIRAAALNPQSSLEKIMEANQSYTL
ncbi:helix-turn-helix domain-containing protein [Planobispora longispora]|uniref:Transcriptional regulator n=1 Tax=Planobispora longispora TaxID=28887 RepID=A0A8J3RH92_9ACTN|nr:helix-turn-helix transcriptional regulator [Planobispora longispora]BFE87028.1 helix-turn-helix transcriptional regulator [Planobispora longispora]GIH74695.1 transcriptional regulator [Planobispora longispora]